MIDNWPIYVLILAAVVVVGLWIKRFTSLPSAEQQAKIKEWLLYAVIMAEKEFGSGTGKLKLASVYAEFLEVFPDLASIISFELFSSLVDEVLVQMREILETNKDIEAYVEN